MRTGACRGSSSVAAMASQPVQLSAGLLVLFALTLLRPLHGVLLLVGLGPLAGVIAVIARIPLDGGRLLEAAGAEHVDASRGPVLNQASMAIDAAIDGQGVALARSALAAWDTIGGRLVRPFALALPAAFAYWIVCPKATAKLPKIAAFTDWLLAEAADDIRRLQKPRSRSRAGRGPR